MKKKEERLFHLSSFQSTCTKKNQSEKAIFNFSLLYKQIFHQQNVKQNVNPFEEIV